MDFMKRSWAQVSASLERLSFAEKGLIVCLLVIIVLSLGIGLYFAAAPQRVPIPYGGDVSAAVALLQSKGIDARAEGNQLLVSADTQYQAISALAEQHRMGGDAIEAFAKLVKADPWETNAQLRSKYMVALQTYLGKVVSRMEGVQAASVMIALPEHKGFGRTTARPSASIMVEMQGGGGVPKDMVKALASLASGAVAEMRPQDVQIIDGGGRSYRIDDPADQLPTEALELVRSEEAYHKKKIEELLRITGAIVAVSVDMDKVRKQRVETTTYQETEPIVSESSSEIVTRDLQQGGEGGVRPNAGLDIAGGGGGVTREHRETTTQNEFGPKMPTQHVQQEIAGHQLQRINVTINVPRQYFVRIFQARNPEGEVPDDTVLQPIISEQLALITDKIEPLITKGDSKGVVRASMYFDEPYLLPATAGVSSAGFGAIAADYGGTALLAVLGLAALGMMLYLVKRTTQEEDMPTVEDLAGVPQTLPSDDELLGEAEEVENTMAGVELDENQLMARKISEQISEMIKASPKEAASLLGKWVAVDD